MGQKNQKGTPDVSETPDVPEIEAQMFPNDLWYGLTDGKVQFEVVEQDEELYRYLSKIKAKVRAVNFWQDDHLVCATVWTEPWNIKIELWYCGDLLESALRGMSIWTAILRDINRERAGWSSGMIKTGKD